MPKINRDPEESPVCALRDMYKHSVRIIHRRRIGPLGDSRRAPAPANSTSSASRQTCEPPLPTRHSRFILFNLKQHYLFEEDAGGGQNNGSPGPRGRKKQRGHDVTGSHIEQEVSDIKRTRCLLTLSDLVLCCGSSSSGSVRLARSEILKFMLIPLLGVAPRESAGFFPSV